MQSAGGGAGGAGAAGRGAFGRLRARGADRDAAAGAAVCAASVIDADRLRRQGAMALRRSREGLVVEAAKPRGSIVRGRRPQPTRRDRTPPFLRRACVAAARRRRHAGGGRSSGGGR